jgi:glycosyltransferase involved in cell wall biosynthesis
MPHKNHQLLFQILDVVAARGIPLRVALTVSREELEKFGGDVAMKLIESGHILPLGWVKKEHLKAVYDASDACLMPSLLESLSSAHLEAMQWGKPQISSDAPFATDLCGDAAVYVSAGSPGEWV